MDSVGSRVMDVFTVAGVREQRGVSSRFAACVLLCSLVAALRRIEKPLLSACCHAAALLYLAPLPPAPVAVANANAMQLPLPPKPG